MTSAQHLYVTMLRRGIWLRRRGFDDLLEWRLLRDDAVVTAADIELLRNKKVELLEVCDLIDPESWTIMADPRGGVFTLTLCPNDFLLAVAEAA